VHLAVAELVADGGEEAVLGVDDLGAGVEDEEVTGAVGVLRLARIERRLAEGRGLLVAQDARDGHLAQQRRGLDVAVHLGGGADLGEHRLRDAERLEDVVAPLEGLEVEEQRARRVGHVGLVHAAVDAAGQVPEDPGVGRAEDQVAGLGLLARTLDVLEDPDDLGAREVGREREADDRLEAVRSLVAREAVDDRLRAGVLPHDRVVDGLAGGLVPDDRGLALVGDADRGDVVAGQVGAGERLADDLADVVPDLDRVVLDPARAGEDLLVLLLAGGDDRALLVEDDRAGRRRPLVDRDDVVSHVQVLLRNECGRKRRGARQRMGSRTSEDQPASSPPTIGPAIGTHE
jgi:hypothetical protein